MRIFLRHRSLRRRVAVAVAVRLDDVEQSSLVDLVSLHCRLEIGSVGLVKVFLLVAGMKCIGKMFASGQGGFSNGR